MLSNSDPVSFQATSDREELLHLVEQICPKEESEPTCAYKAFSDLAISGSSVKKLAEEYHESATSPTTDINALKGWADQYCWRSRLATWKPIYEAYQFQKQHKREREILERWNSSRQKILDLADELLARATLMLKYPHIQKTIYDEVVSQYVGQIIATTTVIMPTKWKASDIVNFQKTALALIEQVVGDRQIMIDRLTADGYVITDVSRGDFDIRAYVASLKKLEEAQNQIDW